MRETRSRASSTRHRPTPDYAAIARSTRERVDWPRLLASTKWKWLENVRNFSIYTQPKETHSSGSKILAMGAVKGSVREIGPFLTASAQLEYCDQMTALHDRDFKCGTYIASIPNENSDSTTQLSLRLATFARQSLFHRDEMWCFLDAVTYNDATDALEITSTALNPRDVARGKSSGPPSVIFGYRVQAEVPNGSDDCDRTRVHFFAELLPATGRSSQRDAVYGRMLRLARSVERLSLLVRRRRLGAQVLIDAERTPSLVNHRCFNCGQRQLIAKLCRVCGNGVCTNCSGKYEREARVSRPRDATIRIEVVRVCDPCLKRIDANVAAALPHAANSSTCSDPCEGKDVVGSVFPCRLDLDRGRSRTVSGASTAPISEDNFGSTLEDSLLVAVESDAELSEISRNESGLPILETDADRLQDVDALDVVPHGAWDELDIVCDVAAREVGALASIVSVVTRNGPRVVAANHRQFKDLDPIIEPQPVIGKRLSFPSSMARKGQLRFYCGFPLMNADCSAVAGTLCCLDHELHNLTKSQHQTLRRLAAMAAKIVRLDAKRRRVVM